MHGQLGRLMVAIGAFEFGNLAATLMILRATDLLGPGRTHTSAVRLALVLYTAYNAAATLASIPAGRAADRIGTTRVLAIGLVDFMVRGGSSPLGRIGKASLGSRRALRRRIRRVRRGRRWM